MGFFLFYNLWIVWAITIEHECSLTRGLQSLWYFDPNHKYQSYQAGQLCHLESSCYQLQGPIVYLIEDINSNPEIGLLHMNFNDIIILRYILRIVQTYFKSIFVQWQIHSQSISKWPFFIQFGLKLHFHDNSQ